MDGKSSCCLEDTLNRAANLSNEVESSRILCRRPRSDQWVDIRAETGSHIMVEIFQQDLQVRTPDLQLVRNANNDQTFHQLPLLLYISRCVQ